MEQNIIHTGHAIDVLKTLPGGSIDCVMTSPPYWNLRDYKQDKQIGNEATPKEFINNLCKIFDEVKRVLKDEGTIFKQSKEKNYRTVWRYRISSGGTAHCATYPEGLIHAPIMAGCPEEGIVLDPFIGSGTTAVVALKLGRKYIGIEINEEYKKAAEKRIKEVKDGNI